MKTDQQRINELEIEMTEVRKHAHRAARQVLDLTYQLNSQAVRIDVHAERISAHDEQIFDTIKKLEGVLAVLAEIDKEKLTP